MNTIRAWKNFNYQIWYQDDDNLSISSTVLIFYKILETEKYSK